MIDHIADASKMVADNPGVQGLAQLGRNAIERVSELERENATLVGERDRLIDVLYRAGFTKCDVPACNCGSWHHRYGLPERMQEIKDCLSDAGHPCDNSNGWLPRNALLQLIAERDALRARLAAIDAAQTVAVVWFAKDANGNARIGLDYGENLPPIGTELIARPAKE